MKTFEIWSEGYLCTGMEGIPSDAYKHGVATGESFKEACCNFAKRDPVFAEDFNPEKLTYWGCKLYSNHTDAQIFTIISLNNRYDEDMIKNKSKYDANLEKLRGNPYDLNDVKNIPQKTTEDRRREWLKAISEGKIYDQPGLENQLVSE